MSSGAVMCGWKVVGGQTMGGGGDCEGGAGDQDGEPSSSPHDDLPPLSHHPVAAAATRDHVVQDKGEETDPLLSNSVSDAPCETFSQDNLTPNGQTKSDCHIRIFSPSECSGERASECGRRTCGDDHTHTVNTCNQGSVSSRENNICNADLNSPDDQVDMSVEQKSFVDISTQTGLLGDGCTRVNVGGDHKSYEVENGSGSGCECHIHKKFCPHGQSEGKSDIRNVNDNMCNNREAQMEQDANRLNVDRTVTSKLLLADKKQKSCNSDYSSLSSCDSSRGSDSSTRSDSGNSPGSSSSSSSSTNDRVNKNTGTSNKKVSMCGDLSPIASCGGESTTNTGLTVNVSLTPDSTIKDIGGRSPCTPTSGCLKDGTRAPTGAHVQFDTPYDDEDTSVLRDTLVTQDGQVTIHKPHGGSTTPTQGDQTTRLWSKFIPESSPSEVTSNMSASKKLRRRQISGSSSISLGSSSSDSSNSHGTELERRAPDGGWGWVIVAASFMVHCIADGVTMSFGVLFVELLSYFQEGKSLTSWVGSLFMAIPLLAGPLASLLTDRYGCQTVTICGAVVASFGFFVSAFVNTIPLLLLTVGVITGLGLAVCYVAAIVIVAFYFEKKRSLATGIAVAGSGIGTFLFAPLIQYLVDYWGWRLCFIILAGLFLNMVVCGALMRDLEWTPRDSSSLRDANTTTVSSHRGSTSQSSETVGGRGGSVATGLPSLEELRRLVQSGDVAALLSPDDTPSGTLRGSASLVLLPTFLSRSQALPPDVIPCLSSRTNAYEVVSQMYPHLLSHSLSGHVNQVDQIHTPLDKKQHSKSQMEKMLTYASTPFSSIGSSAGLSPDKPDPIIAQHLTKGGQPCSDTDSTTPGSVGGDTSLQNGNRKRLDIKLGFSTEDDDGDDADNEEENDDPKEMTAMLASVRVRGGRQPGIRRISTGCMGASSPPPPAAPLRNMRVNRQSMTYRGAMLNIHRYRLRASSCPDIYRNSIITLAKSQDEVLMGYVGDQAWSSPMLIYNISMVICGLSVLSMPFITNYWLLAVASAVFGLFISANYALTSVILVELVSLEAFSKTYGLLLLIQGVANLIGPPLVGYIADATGNYTVPFVISGFFIIGCGLILNAIPLIQRYHNQYPSSTSSPDDSPKNGSPTSTPIHTFKKSGPSQV
ncbi:uncharacterized protein LOC121878082 isoform X2 [Homarus americanus]|uniref:uncharacterized protein LOC121878082 isoform X2 n=1 Tax=Homarus americanus TaxID=6706 RepID=UPI001C4875A6|nr:uncharacterized protein LOC121878082 isoform X2 [Homarus americanus]